MVPDSPKRKRGVDISSSGNSTFLGRGDGLPEQPPYAAPGDAQGEDQRVALLFSDLVCLPPDDRQTRLLGLATASPAVADELRALLTAADAAGDFLGSFSPSPVAGDAPDGLAANRVLAGRYRLVRRLSEGGAGVVWLARDTHLDRLVALKFLRGRDMAAIRRMREEARLAARLDSPYVAVVHDAGVLEEDGPFMAMAFSSGGSLADRLKTGPLPLNAALDVAIQASRALEAAHDAGIVHGDVKPGNLLLGEDGSVRLTDFGVAQSVGDALDSAPALGTLCYMAPEQLLGGGFDHRADLWALGVTLYQALTGRLPFTGGSTAAVLYDIVCSEPVAPGSLASLPHSLETLILDLLRKSPAARPTTASLVASRLEEIRTGVIARMRTMKCPVAPTPLIGRELEVDRLMKLLGERRLVTLTGAGGTGKTRLALELAARAEASYEGGACFVELATQHDERQVPNLIAQTLGIADGGAVDVLDRLLLSCRGVKRLLVLDNCEHLSSLSGLVTLLLSSAPELRILATSRSPLGVNGEQEFAVAPLTLPPPGESHPERLSRVPAIALLLARVRDRDPGFVINDENAHSLAEICCRLDGLPLALELAAPWVPTLGSAVVMERLGDSTGWLHAVAGQRPTRHQTLKAAIEWSYELLGDDEQRLFRHLAPFSGGFDLDAVLEVAGAIGLSAHAEDIYFSLVGRNLVMLVHDRADPPRGRLLVTIRDFAMSRMRECGEEAKARDLHAVLFLHRATDAAVAMHGPREVAAHERLRDDGVNLRDALDWFISSHDLVRAARLAVALHRHWLLSGRSVQEIVQRLEGIDEACRQSVGGIPGLLHADLLNVLGSLSGVAGKHQSVPWDYFRRAQAAYRKAANVRGEALALNHLGWSSLLLGRYDDSGRYSDEAKALHRQSGNVAGEAVSLINLGWVALLRGGLSAAESCFLEALSIQESLGDERAAAYANGHLGTVALRRGDPSAALAYLNHERMRVFDKLEDRVAAPTFGLRRVLALHESRQEPGALTVVRDTLLPILRESNHGWSLAYALSVLGRLLIDADDPIEAMVALHEGIRIAETAGLVSLAGDCEAVLSEALAAAGRPDEAAASLRDCIEVRQRIGEPLGVVEGAELAAEWLIHAGRPSVARPLLEEVAVIRLNLHATRLPRLADRMAGASAACGIREESVQASPSRPDSGNGDWRALAGAVLRALTAD